MNLQPNECDQFYRIWWSLLSYVNKQMKLFNDFSSQLENNNIKQQDAAVIRNALWASDRLLQDFIDSNPNNLSDADLELAASWKNRVAAKFFIMRYLQKSISMPKGHGFALTPYKGALGIINAIT